MNRVLRAYYTEKGRPFPEWLGPDPRESQQSIQGGGLRSGGLPLVGSMRSNASSATSKRGSGGTTSGGLGGGGGLGDLFSDTPSPSMEPEPISLRSRPGAGGGGHPPTMKNRLGAGLRTADTLRTNSYDSIPQQSSSMLEPAPTTNPRPLPSQRAGSYQNRQALHATPDRGTSSPPPSASSMQDRLKARLGGSSSPRPSTAGNSTSSSSSQGQGFMDRAHPLSKQSQSANSNPYSGNNDPYNYPGPSSQKGAGRPGGADPYEAPSRPGRSGGGGGNSYGGGGGQSSRSNTQPSAGANTPYMSASSPWVTGDDPYGGGNPYGAGGGKGGYDGGGGGGGGGARDGRGPEISRGPRMR